MSEELYSLPLYYDIAFSWDLEPEIGWFGRLFKERVPFPVENILEPACGTGRFLTTLPKHGYRVTGYDLSDDMLDYARGRVEAEGTSDSVTLVKADMATAAFPREFDAALNSINSLGYLLEDDDIVSHFRLTGEALKPGGIYIVHISCGWEGPLHEEGSIWEMERDGVRVKIHWRIEREDFEAKRSHHICTMEIDDHGDKRVLVDRHELRLWTYEELRDLVDRSGSLELVAIYTDTAENKPVPLDSHLNGEMGNLYFIMQAR